MYQLAFNFDLQEVIKSVQSNLLDAQEIEKVDFSDEEVLWIIHRVLEDALEILERKDCKEQKEEILRWIYAPDIQYFRGKMTHAVDIPFSYQFCCHVIGAKRDRLQSELEFQLKQRNFQY